MFTVHDYNSQIISLWNTHQVPFSRPLRELPPLLIPNSPPKNGIAIVGINPSFPKCDEGSIEEGSAGLKFHPKDLKEIQLKNHENLPYFTRILGTFEKYNLKKNRLWFLDLFPIRHTNQKEVVRFMDRNPDFKKILLALFWKLISSQELSLIVVLNAKASDFVIQNGKNFNSSFHRSSSMMKAGGTPWVFSGMITGGGSMDKYSRERLFNEIRDNLN
ncbi:hypothetical protein N9E48_10950 [Paracoccaceae bacterium]|nr:hypothetical protein [Paracoccaceae bacterium]